MSNGAVLRHRKEGTALCDAFLVQTRGPYAAAMAIGQESFTDTPVRMMLQLLWHPEPIIITQAPEPVNWNGWCQRAYFLDFDTDSNTTLAA